MKEKELIRSTKTTTRKIIIISSLYLLKNRRNLSHLKRCPKVAMNGIT